MGFEAMH